MIQTTGSVSNDWLSITIAKIHLTVAVSLEPISPQSSNPTVFVAKISSHHGVVLIIEEKLISINIKDGRSTSPEDGDSSSIQSDMTRLLLSTGSCQDTCLRIVKTFFATLNRSKLQSTQDTIVRIPHRRNIRNTA